ncbi:MAG: DNA repair protein RecN [Chitinophagales bacterium]
MLQRIYIKNFAIIDEVQIEFNERLNIITGETGAGKSIILGALGLLKGDRANAQMVRNSTLRAIVEGEFVLNPSKFQSLFQNLNLVFKERTIIRREINSDGKGKSLVNDQTVNLNQLQTIGNWLTEIHSQHDSLEIKSSDFQLDIVDVFAGNVTLLEEMKNKFTKFKSTQKELQLALDSESKSQADKDLQIYHLQELNQFDFDDWNLEKLEEELALCENALEIKQQLATSIMTLSESETNLLDGLREVLSKLRKFDKYSKELGEINAALDVSIDSIAGSVRGYGRLMDRTDLNEEKLIELREQFQFIYKNLKKHGLSSIAELTEHKVNLQKTLDWNENLGEKIQELQHRLHAEEKDCISIAEQLSDKRKFTRSVIESKLVTNLIELELGNSQFEIEINTDHKLLSSQGFDKVTFLFTANAGTSLKELKNAISGGEMSRFVLAIKSLLADKISLPTLVFDEIDTGVSGLVANRVASMLFKLSQNHQIIAITHLPQIASQGFHHFKVFKTTENNLTSTNIKLLHQADREIEIAQMISGEHITQASLTSARELLAH